MNRRFQGIAAALTQHILLARELLNLAVRQFSGLQPAQCHHLVPSRISSERSSLLLSTPVELRPLMSKTIDFLHGVVHAWRRPEAPSCGSSPWLELNCAAAASLIGQPERRIAAAL